jgi:hypothetical protein
MARSSYHLKLLGKNGKGNPKFIRHKKSAVISTLKSRQ